MNCYRLQRIQIYRQREIYALCVSLPVTTNMDGCTLFFLAFIFGYGVTLACLPFSTIHARLHGRLLIMIVACS
jgi:hypothetical protein